MIFSDSDIIAAIKTGELEIDPFDESLLNPNSIDLRLNRNGFANFVPKDIEISCSEGCHSNMIDGFIDPFDESTYSYDYFSADEVKIPAGGFMLASVIERTFFHGNITGHLTGKSSLARLGLAVHITAGLGDAGWDGIYTLELVNHNNREIKLYAGMSIAQLEIVRTGIVLEPYGVKKKSKYQNQKAGQGSKYYLNERKE